MFVAAIFAIVWVIGTPIAAFFILFPKRSWPPVATRLRSLGLSLALFFACPLAFSAVADLDPAYVAGSKQREAAQAAAAQAKALADAAPPAPSNNSDCPAADLSDPWMRDHVPGWQCQPKCTSLG